jgi:hypothetical protein
MTLQQVQNLLLKKILKKKFGKIPSYEVPTWGMILSLLSSRKRGVAGKSQVRKRYDVLSTLSLYSSIFDISAFSSAV